MDGRAALLPQLFGEVGKNVWIVPPLTAAVGKYVSIGDGTYANMNLTLIDDWIITIGKNVLIGPNVTLCTTGHGSSEASDRRYVFLPCHDWR